MPEVNNSREWNRRHVRRVSAQSCNHHQIVTIYTTQSNPLIWLRLSYLSFTNACIPCSKIGTTDCSYHQDPSRAKFRLLSIIWSAGTASVHLVANDVVQWERPHLCRARADQSERFSNVFDVQRFLCLRTDYYEYSTIIHHTTCIHMPWFPFYLVACLNCFSNEQHGSHTRYCLMGSACMLSLFATAMAAFSAPAA